METERVCSVCGIDRPITSYLKHSTAKKHINCAQPIVASYHTICEVCEDNYNVIRYMYGFHFPYYVYL